MKLIYHAFSTVLQKNFDCINIENLVINYKYLRYKVLKSLLVYLFDPSDLLKQNFASNFFLNLNVLLYLIMFFIIFFDVKILQIYCPLR